MISMVCYPYDAAVMCEPTILRNPKANQACLSCRKQKRKCDKALPSCALCTRMSRFCDYSEYPPNPTVDDIEALRSRLSELEAKLQEAGRQASIDSISPPSVELCQTRNSPSYSSEVGWHFGSNAYDPASILDGQFFREANLPVGRPSIEIPQVVLNYVGDLDHVQHVVTNYFNHIQPWFPIIRYKRKCLTSPLWDGSPETTLLLLSMMLMADRPPEGVMPNPRNYLYRTAKSFAAQLEDAGVTSLYYLQSIILIALYEYSHAIYPVGWMTVGQCVRYVDFLGIPFYKESNSMLGQCATWLEAEERRRAWWAIYILDKAMCAGSDKRSLCSEPCASEVLPVSEEAWNTGDACLAVQHKISSASTSEPVSPFARLCQSALLVGKALRHCRKAKTTSLQHEAPDHAEASSLIEMAFSLSACLSSELVACPKSYSALLAARCLTYTAIHRLIGAYLSSTSYSTVPTPTLQTAASWPQETLSLQVMSFEAKKRATTDMIDMASTISAYASLKEDLPRLSPFILNSLYSSGVTFSWWREESGDTVSASSLEMVKKCLLRISCRWHLATEYTTLLEQQEMSAMSRSTYTGPLTSVPLLASTIGI